MEEEIAVKIHTKAVHAGDRKKPGPAIPTTTPICTATAFTYDKMEELDRIFGREVPGYSYSRYDSPTSAALMILSREVAADGGRSASRRSVQTMPAKISSASTRWVARR